MILPIVAYGDPVLKTPANDIPSNMEGLQELIDNMFETMESASGVGLAAPQVARSVRLFVVDTSPLFDEENEEDENEFAGEQPLREAFINPQILESTGDDWAFEEGCLSIPKIREEIYRPPEVHIRYTNLKGEQKELRLKGYAARVVQHEYDHIEGILFTDKLPPLRRRLLKRKLSDISKGLVDVNYKMRFPTLKAKKA